MRIRALLPLCLFGIAGPVGAQVDSTEALLSAAVILEVQARGVAANPADVALLPVDGSTDTRYVVWMARLPTDTTTYLLASIGGMIFRLGGFRSPQLVEFVKSLGAGTDPLLLSRRLAILADPNGATAVLLESRGATNAIRRHVRSSIDRKAGYVGHDAIIRLRDGRQRVVLTVYSQRAPRASIWQSLRYTFDWDPVTTLVNWSREVLKPTQFDISASEMRELENLDPFDPME